MTILLIGENDRQQFGCKLLAQQLRRRGQKCLTIGSGIKSSGDTNSTLSPYSADLDLTVNEVMGSRLLEDVKAIGLFLKGSDQLQWFCDTYRTICRQLDRHSAPIFSGPLSPQAGDQLTADISKRLCCDLLMVPGERQRQEAAAMTFSWPEPEHQPQICSTGLWFMPERPPVGSLVRSNGERNKILVALVQGNIPGRLSGKSQILKHLIALAQAARDWTVVVTRDHSWTKGQPWVQGFKSSRKTLPNNLQFSAPGQMLDLIAACSACITVSSTWIFTAMAWGRPSMIIGDFGVRSDVETTTFFGSGCMHRLTEIEHPDQLLDLPGVNQAWLNAMGWGVHNGTDRLISALDQIHRNRA